MIDDQLEITEDLVIILPVCQAWAGLLSYVILFWTYLARQAQNNSVNAHEIPQNAVSHQSLYCLPPIQLF